MMNLNNKKICLAGLGYVGLPLAVAFSDKFQVIGFDATKPDGAPRKLINVTQLLNMGWKYSIDLEEGLKKNL
jgi:UDP-N-acetyl-D-mannosaminuronate dehydrogenase